MAKTQKTGLTKKHWFGYMFGEFYFYSLLYRLSGCGYRHSGHTGDYLDNLGCDQRSDDGSVDGQSICKKAE